VSVARWAETLAFVDERRQVVLDRDPGGRDGVDLLEIELVRSCLTGALGERRLRDEALASAGAAATAAAISWVRDRGRVELPVAGGVRSLPAGGVAIGPGEGLGRIRAVVLSGGRGHCVLRSRWSCFQDSGPSTLPEAGPKQSPGVAGSSAGNRAKTGVTRRR